MRDARRISFRVGSALPAFFPWRFRSCYAPRQGPIAGVFRHAAREKANVATAIVKDGDVAEKPQVIRRAGVSRAGGLPFPAREIAAFTPGP